MSDRTNAQLLDAAAAGEKAAWDALVANYHRLVWAVARGFRLNDADAADVCQTTWLRLVEHLGRIRNPDQLPAWLATTTRHECIRMLRRAKREIPDDGDELEARADQSADPDEEPEAALIADEERNHLRSAVRQLSERCQLLLRVLAVTPLPSYADVAAALGMPIGGIGPTRARCLAKLRRLLDIGADPGVSDA